MATPAPEEPRNDAAKGDTYSMNALFAGLVTAVLIMVAIGAYMSGYIGTTLLFSPLALTMLTITLYCTRLAMQSRTSTNR